MKRATITIDNIAAELFPKVGDKKSRTYSAILTDVLGILQSKGDDPGYSVVVFTSGFEGKFVEVRESGVRQTGVFTRITGTRFELHEAVLRNLYGSRDFADLLIVAKESTGADFWNGLLNGFGYNTRRI
ncbi:MAG: hypothetical protein WCV90_06530 [Candidatus Woesearchaeota archaeon]|jgi:hypothetical protein